MKLCKQTIKPFYINKVICGIHSIIQDAKDFSAKSVSNIKGEFMTEGQIHQYNIRYVLDDYTCQKCKLPASQIAHRIAKTKVNYKVYGCDIIDHNINLVASCALCNCSFNIGNMPEKSKRLKELISKKGDAKISTQVITMHINRDDL